MRIGLGRCPRRLPSRGALIAVTFVLISAGPSSAQQDRDWKDCSSSDMPTRLAGCTRVIDRTTEPRKNRANAFVRRGIAYLSMRDFDRAILDLDQATRLDPKMTDAYGNRAVAHIAKKDFDRALQDADEAIRLDSKNAGALNNRGVAYREKGDLARALADFDLAVRLDPKGPRPYFHRGVVHHRLGDTSRAVADLRRSLQLDATQADARELLAQVEAGTKAVTAPTPPAPSPPEPSRTPASERRVALVIGNSAYANVPPLTNPQRDAAAVARLLEKLGFEVKTYTDVTREGLLSALLTFARNAEKADWGLVFFAGHGIEVAGVNYLIPIDARLMSDRDAPLEAVPLDQVLGAVERAGKLRVVILDACRDNPFAGQMRRTIATRSVGRGLTRVEPEAGTLVVYSAKHGETALDGEGTNSPFVKALLQNLASPGIELRRVFDLVRDDVLEATSRRQQPFSYGSLPGRQDFYLVQDRRQQ
jgi:Tfp pilus assembly protein PilF